MVTKIKAYLIAEDNMAYFKKLVINNRTGSGHDTSKFHKTATTNSQKNWFWTRYV